MIQYLLFDGVQCPADIHAQLERSAAVRIYEDLGAEAARVGPILAVSDTSLRNAALGVALGNPRRHALSELHSLASLATVAQHLLAVRYMHLNEHSQHFVRYADSRCLVALMEVLSNEQKATLFGPIEQWDSWDRAGDPISYRRPGAAASTGSLRLSTTQQRALFKLTAPDQLLAEVLADEPALAGHGSDYQRHAWVVAAMKLLEHHRMRAFPWQLAVANAAVRSYGKALDDRGFGEILEDAFARDDVDALYDWASPLEVP